MEKEKVIRLNEIDDLLKEYNEMGYEGETFEDFIKETKDDGYYIWEETEEFNLERVKNEDYENEDELERAYRERRGRDLNKSKAELNKFEKQKNISPNETDLIKKIPLSFSYLKSIPRQQLISKILVLQKHYFIIDKINGQYQSLK